MTAASMFMDSATNFGGNYTPSDADNLERGPVRVRNALQFSLNIPSVKAMAVNTPDHVFARAKDFGMTFQTETPSAGLALALGVQEVRPVDLVTAYGTLANGGQLHRRTRRSSRSRTRPATTSCQPYAAAGRQRRPHRRRPPYIVTDILAGNTNPRVNPFWGRVRDHERGRRPPAGDAEDRHEQRRQGPQRLRLHRRADGRGSGRRRVRARRSGPGTATATTRSSRRPTRRSSRSTSRRYVWQGFLDEATAKWAINDFAVPDGLVQVEGRSLDRRPAAAGQQVGRGDVHRRDRADRRRSRPASAASRSFAYVGFERHHEQWLKDDRNWLERAGQGPGTAAASTARGPRSSTTAAFKPYGNSWGIVEGFGCVGAEPVADAASRCPTPDASGVIPSFEMPTPDPSASGVAAIPCPPASPSRRAVGVRRAVASNRRRSRRRNRRRRRRPSRRPNRRRSRRPTPTPEPSAGRRRAASPAVPDALTPARGRRRPSCEST